MITVSLLAFVLVVSFVYGGINNDAVLLGDIQALTLHRGRETTGRRSAPMPQLVCVGGSAQHRANEVAIVQCYNKGFDGSSYAWECVSEIDKSLKLGQVTVSCEGYHYPEDPQVLKGSCGLEYSLELTQARQVVQQVEPMVVITTTKSETIVSHKTETEDGIAILVILLVMVGMFIVACCLSMAYKTRDNQRTSFSSSGRQYREPEYQYTPSQYTPSQYTSPVIHVEEPSPIRYQQPRETTTISRRTPQPSPTSVFQTTTTIVNPTPVIQQHNTFINTGPAYKAPRQETTKTTTITERASTSASSGTHISKSYGGTKGR